MEHPAETSLKTAGMNLTTPLPVIKISKCNKKELLISGKKSRYMYKDHETPRFWITYSGALQKYLQKRVDDKSLVDDIMHDVYLKVFVFCKRYDFCCEKAGVKNLRSWIFQVCHNAMIDRVRDKTKYSFTTDVLELVSEISTAQDQVSSFQAVEIINKLPEKYAEAVYLDTIIRMNQDCIAKKLGLGISATKSRIQRGKRMLKEIYLRESGN
jgi:RNA polymerase sigma-70 factor (ECF subfamily)